MKLTAKDIAERYNTNVNRIYYYLKKVLGDNYKKSKGKNPVMYDEEIVLRIGNLIQDTTPKSERDKEYWRQKSIRLQKENNNLKMEIDAIQNIKDSIKLLNDLDNQKINQETQKKWVLKRKCLE